MSSTAKAIPSATVTSSSRSLYNKRCEETSCTSSSGGTGRSSISSVVSGRSSEGSTLAERNSSLQLPHIGTSMSANDVSGSIGIRMTRTVIRRRQKVKDFNDLITCSLCRGYLINATTIDYCVHSFCKSCIVKHLQEDKHCPQCRMGGKQISLSNLKPDERLKSLVYKLVPGLYQNEQQRQITFRNEYSATRVENQDDILLCDFEEDYFCPVEPISLSLEYHIESLRNFNKQQIPPIRYLQCPAAVTIHHLKRFIFSKFDIDPNNKRVNIEIIYEDEILPEDFSLMDVGYCYSWKRIAPMRFFYRILIHNLCNKLNQAILGDSVLSESDNIIEAKRTRNNEAGTSKIVRFKDINERQFKEKVTSSVSHPNMTVASKAVMEKAAKYVVCSSNLITNQEEKTTKGVGKDRGSETEGRCNSSAITYNASQRNDNKGSVKMTIITRKSNDMKVKPDLSKNKSKTKKQSTDANIKTSPTTISNDFKSLRSNDIRHNEYSVTSTGSNSTSVDSTTLKKNKSNSNKSKLSYHKESNQRPVSKCDIIVSIPQIHVHRSSNSSDDSFENLSLAQLKTANKKINHNSKGKEENIPNYKLCDVITGTLKPQKTAEQLKLDLPKLKIELPSLKTKITVPKKSPNIMEMKQTPKTPKQGSEDGNSTLNRVDLTAYAKNIGLKPINTALDEKPKNGLENSPSSASSTSSPPSSAGSAFMFSSDASNSSSHKKRKKGKHSKEPKESGSKRRKLHAEIASQPAEESLKLKVKITANHKSHKAEKRSNNVKERIISTVSEIPNSVSSSLTETKYTASNANVSFDKTATETNLSEASETKSEDKTSQDMPKICKKNKQGINIPNLNKTLSEESSNINNLIRENSNSKEDEQLAHAIVKSSVNVNKNKTVAKSISVSSSSTSLNQTSSPNFTSASTLNAPTLKVVSSQETRIPMSPPLPPSLFKTAPMTLQGVTTGCSRLPTPTDQSRFPNLTDTKPISISQLKRVTQMPGPKPTGNFIAPNPPKSVQYSPKPCSITSIASAANRQATQLKRSASLDSNPSTHSKQCKVDQDKLIRKATYTPYFTPADTLNTSAIISSALKNQGTSSIITNATNAVSVETQQANYTTSVGSKYTGGIYARKPTPLLIPPPSINVSKISEVVSSKLTQATSAVTILPQQQQSIQSYQPQTQRPALEIVRISSNIPPVDQQPIAVTNNNTVKPNPPKTIRPPPPPIPLVKIKRSTNQTNTSKPSITTVSAPLQQNAVSNPSKVLSSIDDIKDSKSTIRSVDASNSNGQPPVCDNVGALDLSGKSSRSPSQEKNTPINNTPPDTPIQISNKDQTKKMANTLEAALNKLKQQNLIPTVSTSTGVTQISSMLQSAPIGKKEDTSNATFKLTSTTESYHVTNNSNVSVPKITDSNNELQNLKMLSESATNREKITIKNRPLPMLPKLNEITKMRPNPTVRQQNASVRNIPNPSALAFRSHQHMPMLASITKTTSPQKSTTISTNSLVTITTATNSLITTSTTSNSLVTTTAATITTTATTSTTATISTTISTKATAISVTSQIKEEPVTNMSQTVTSTASSLSEQPSTSANSTNATITTTATTDSSKLIGSKKNLHLEKLTATLNMRALSAIADASKTVTATATLNSNESTNGNTLAVNSTAKTVSTLTTSSVTSTSSIKSNSGTLSLPLGTSHSGVTLASASASTTTVATPTTA